jgi:hypothetical protein
MTPYLVCVLLALLCSIALHFRVSWLERDIHVLEAILAVPKTPEPETEQVPNPNSQVNRRKPMKEGWK